MPYASNEDLPPAVRAHLPPHAQEVFRHAFNRAYARYRGDDAAAFRVAWAAVKKKYEKVDGEWLHR